MTKCLNCGSQTAHKNRFCSVSCAKAYFMNKSREAHKRIERPKENEFGKCIQCGKPCSKEFLKNHVGLCPDCFEHSEQKRIPEYLTDFSEPHRLFRIYRT